MFIPKKHDRFIAILRGYRTRTEARSGACKCKKIFNDYITADDADGYERKFVFGDWYFRKAPKGG